MDEQTIPRPIPNYSPEWPSVTTDSFAADYATASVVIVHFWAVWNGYDPVMEDRLQTAATRLPNGTHILACDVDDAHCLDLAKNAGVLNVPWLAVFVDGKLHGHICGLRDPDSLADELNAIIVTDPADSPRKWWRFWYAAVA